MHIKNVYIYIFIELTKNIWIALKNPFLSLVLQEYQEEYNDFFQLVFVKLYLHMGNLSLTSVETSR